MSTRQQKAEATRQRILEAALERFAEAGFGGTSTRSIAKRAGVSEGLIFHHFPTKLDLLHAVGQSYPTMALGLQQMLRDAPTLSLDAFSQRLGALFLETLRPDRTEARLARVILVEGHADPALAALRQRMTEGVAGALAAWLGTRQAAGEVAPAVDRQAAARLLLGGMVWVLMTNPADPATPAAWAAETRPLLDAVIAQWRRGLITG